MDKIEYNVSFSGEYTSEQFVKDWCIFQNENVYILELKGLDVEEMMDEVVDNEDTLWCECRMEYYHSYGEIETQFFKELSLKNCGFKVSIEVLSSFDNDEYTISTVYEIEEGCVNENEFEL